MTTNLVTFIPIKEVIPFWPGDKFHIPGLEHVGVSRYEMTDTGKGLSVDATILLLSEIKISMPGLDGIALLVGRGDGFTQIDVVSPVSEPSLHHESGVSVAGSTK